MTMYLLYCGLLLAWVLLLWPAFRLKGGPRIWLLIVIAAGIAGAVYETWMYLWSHASIRLDIILISIALAGLYGSAVVLLFAKRWWMTGALVMVIVVGICGAMTGKWIEVSHESDRLHEVFLESNRLLYRAEFRDSETYESHFGPFSGGSGSYPIGHWQVQEPSHLTRLIVNAEGRVWLFYQCQEDAECHSGPGGSGLRQSADNSRHWGASLKPSVGLAFDINIIQLESGALTVEERDRIVRFAEAPPPIDPAPSPQSLRYLGPFVDVACSGDHATVRQVWLWEDGTRAYGVGVFSTLVAGRQNGYVAVASMGVGVLEGDAWRFAWQQEGSSGTALVALSQDDAILTLDKDGRDREDANQAVLKSGTLFDDERIELAPLTTGTDWLHWFDTMMVGHFTSGFVPAC